MLAVAASLTAALSACTGEQTIRGSDTRPGLQRAPALTHIVLITLVDPAQADALIADCNESLPRIPEVIFYGCGRPAEIGRPNVDGQYTVGVLIGFPSEAAYARYLDHPIHQKLVETWKPRWAQARIMDIGDATRP